MNVKINEHIIGKNHPPFIVGEVGINHNGELKTALEMISVAKNAGVDAVKFQTFKAKELVGNSELMFTYKSQGKEITEPMIEMFTRFELKESDWQKIKKFCDEEGIIFFSSPQNRSDLDLLLKLGIPAIKVGSDDFTNLPLLKDFATTNLPMIVSCGMSDMNDVHNALNTIGSSNGYPTILLLTTSQYPTPFEDVNLRKLQTLSREFPSIPLGFSDHTQGPLASSLAVAFGACFFEKHFTLDHNLSGPDHWFSEDPVGLKQWVQSVRSSYIMLGDDKIKPTHEEEKMKILARRSIVTIRDILEGDILDSNNIGLRRPGNGLPPSFLDKIIGMKAKRNLLEGTLLKEGDFSQ